MVKISFFRYLSTGESFRSLAFQYRVHRTTIGRIVNKCLKAIVKHFLHIAIPQPTTESLRQNIQEFYTKWNFPNCCGAIDGKHIRIRCPDNAGSAFFNYKEYHSIVLLAIVDANLKFVAIDVGSYGREGDAGIFQKSSMGRMINRGEFNIPPPAAIPLTDIVLPNVILGDEAFALNVNMMKPYPRQQSLHEHDKAIYNYRHSRARRTTENAFGILCAYFRILFTPIQTTVETIDNIVVAACILYNMMRTEKIESPRETSFGNFGTAPIEVPASMVPLAPVAGRVNVEGARIRDEFKNYFNGIGAVEWQERMTT